MDDEIIAQLISNKAELGNHSCGNESIDKMLQESFMPQLCRQRDTYKIIYDEQVVGFYSWFITSVNLENSDTEVASYYDTTPSFGVLYIKFISVDHDIQGYGIGTTILGHIVKEAKKLEKNWPVRLIVFDALRERVEWYRKLGFELLFQSELETESETVKMYMDLMTCEEHNALSEFSN